MIDIEQIAAATNAQLQPNGSYLGHCPAHDDRNPSFSISLGDNGKPLVKCWSNCSQEEIIAALKERGVWPSGQGEQWSHEDKEQARQPEKAKVKADRQRKYGKAAALALTVWRSAVSALPNHQYLERKQVTPTDTLREIDLVTLKKLIGYHPKANGQTLADGRILIVPIINDGHISSIEMVDENGLKTALAGGRKKDGYWPARKLSEVGGTAHSLLVGEGVATCLSGMEATGHLAVAALASNNLVSVAKQMRALFSDADITILADLVKTTGKPDPHAIEAAREIGGKLAIPDFGPDRPEGMTDINDLFVTKGAAAVTACIEAAVVPEQQGLPAGSDPPLLNTDSLFLFRKDENGILKLLPQSIGAETICNRIKSKYSLDWKTSSWHRWADCYWKSCDPSEAESEITELIQQGTGPFGFSNAYQRGIVDLMKKLKTIRLPERLPGTIPFQNGLLELATRNLIPVSPENATTWALPCEFVKDAQCPNFLAWLRQAVDDDEGTVQLIRAWINALLVGRPDLQIFLHLVGPAGTGKSTLGRIFFYLVGNENATTTTLKQLETNRFETASFYGKLLVAVEEADKYGGGVSVLKAMTGQDHLRLERKNQQQQNSFTYTGQVLLTSNERTSTNDNTSGIERRRVTVEFTRRLSLEERAAWTERGGEETILHSEVSGIINWALKLTGSEVTAIFKKLPERIRRANLDAAKTNNPVLDWMLCSLIPDQNSSVQVGNNQTHFEGGEKKIKWADSRLYPNYLTYCLRNGRQPLSTQRFWRVVIDQAASYGVSLIHKRKMDGTKILGVRFRHDSEVSWGETLDAESQNVGHEGAMKDNALILHDMNQCKGGSITSIYGEEDNNASSHICGKDNNVSSHTHVESTSYGSLSSLSATYPSLLLHKTSKVLHQTPETGEKRIKVTV